MGRRNSSFIPGISIISSDGCASSTAFSSNSCFSNPIGIWVRVWCCFVTLHPKKFVVFSPGTPYFSSSTQAAARTGAPSLFLIFMGKQKNLNKSWPHRPRFFRCSPYSAPETIFYDGADFHPGSDPVPLHQIQCPCTALV